MIETFHFTQGLNRRRGRLYLQEGEMYTCDNFSMEHEGVLESRSARTQDIAIDTTATSKINGIHRYVDSVVASSKAYCPGGLSFFNYIYQRDKDGTAFTNIDLLAGNDRPVFSDYEKFIFVVDGESKRAYIDENEYVWGIDNPTHAPAVAVGAAGNPSGTYNCKVTYTVVFPNGKQYETGASASDSVVLASEICEWSGIPTCPYTGVGLLIYRNLYRDVSGTFYLAATISDNTTTTYSDDLTDTILQTKTAYDNTGYSTPPDFATDLEVYLQRMWLIKGNALYWSEAYMPFVVKTTSNVVITKEDEDLVGVIHWADQLFLASKERWYRLQGTDPASWSVKGTFADHGIVNGHTIKRTKQGILGLDYDGVYLFNGYTCQNLTEVKLGRDFFLDLDDLDVCYAEYDGEIYHLYYASSGSVIDSSLKIDFTHGHANLQMYTGDFLDAHEYYPESSLTYFALSGYEYLSGGSETIDFTVISGDRAFGNIGKLKNLRYLYYDIDTDSEDVTVSFYVDGTAYFTETLNTSARVRARSQVLPQIEGYRFALGITCADAQNVKIYSPWVLEATEVGD